MSAQTTPMAPLTRERALNIVNRLREGVPPAEDVVRFSIGREDLLGYFEGVLDEVARYGQQGIKFIQAGYGHGKTHFLDMLAQLALARSFVVSFVSLDRERAPFNKLERVLPSIMANIATPRTRQGGLGCILQEWAERVRNHDTNTILTEINDEEQLRLLFPDFRLNLAKYARAYGGTTAPRFEECLKIEKWFRGEESKGIRDVPGYLAAFVRFIRYLGYAGFVVMLDEAESITLLSRITNRDQANENLRQIIDNQDLVGFYFVFASTPSFLGGEDDRGAQTYPALWRRISDPLGSIGQRALDKIIIELPALSLQEVWQLASRIKAIFEVAYDREVPRVREEHLQELSRYVMERSDKSVRTLVRSTVMLLDEARKDDQLDVLSNYELIVERIVKDEERRRAL